MVKSMADGSGRMAVVLPQGALFRNGAEGDIRQKLLHADLIEAVIGLAPKLSYGTGLAASILVLRLSSESGMRRPRGYKAILTAKFERRIGAACNLTISNDRSTYQNA